MFEKYIIRPVKKFFMYLAASKTLMFNFAIGLVGAIQTYSTYLQGFFSDEKFFGLFLVVIAGIGAALRFVTTQPISKKIR